jgi:RNA-binding protein
LRPVVLIGKAGLSEALCKEIDVALLAHELIKVKVASDAPVETREAGASLAERLGAQVAQVIGHIVVLYRAHPKQPKIVIPKR